MQRRLCSRAALAAPMGAKGALVLHCTATGGCRERCPGIEPGRRASSAVLRRQGSPVPPLASSARAAAVAAVTGKWPPLARSALAVPPAPSPPPPAPIHRASTRLFCLTAKSGRCSPRATPRAASLSSTAWTKTALSACPIPRRTCPPTTAPCRCGGAWPAPALPAGCAARGPQRAQRPCACGLAQPPVLPPAVLGRRNWQPAPWSAPATSVLVGCMPGNCFTRPLTAFAPTLRPAAVAGAAARALHLRAQPQAPTVCADAGAAEYTRGARDRAGTPVCSGAASLSGPALLACSVVPFLRAAVRGGRLVQGGASVAARPCPPACLQSYERSMDEEMSPRALGLLAGRHDDHLRRSLSPDAADNDAFFVF